MSITVMKQALEALEKFYSYGFDRVTCEKAITAIKEEMDFPDNQKQPVAWMYDWTTQEGEFVQGMTTDDFSSLKDPIGKISNIRPLYFSHPKDCSWPSCMSESAQDYLSYKTMEELGEPTAYICQGNLYWSTDVDPYCTAEHIPLYVTPPLRQAIAEAEQDGQCKRCTNGCVACDARFSKAEKQEPVAMKFKIYKPTVPDPTRQGINNALLPWVYDQDRSSGFDASMWVTPVATLPPQRQPLTDEQIEAIANEYGAGGWICDFARAIEAAHGIGEKK